jgi:hypothetical protein
VPMSRRPRCAIGEKRLKKPRQSIAMVRAAKRIPLVSNASGARLSVVRTLAGRDRTAWLAIYKTRTPDHCAGVVWSLRMPRLAHSD